MNEVDRNRFARYKPGYIESLEKELDQSNVVQPNIINIINKIGFIDKIDINQENLVNDILKELEEKQKQ